MIDWRVTRSSCLTNGVPYFSPSWLKQVMDLTIRRHRQRSQWWPRRRPARPPTANTCVSQVNKTIVPKNWSGFFHFSTDRTALNSFCVIYSDCSANEWPGRPICLPIWTACPPSSNIDSLSPHPRCHPVTTATANKREQLDIATGSVSLSLFIRFYRKTMKSAIAWRSLINVPYFKGEI